MLIGYWKTTGIFWVKKTNENKTPNKELDYQYLCNQFLLPRELWGTQKMYSEEWEKHNKKQYKKTPHRITEY